MSINNNLYLSDIDFLTAIIQQSQHDIYVRITSLDINDNPLEQIEGKATGGSINIDGNSSVRRTCNITMITNNININDFYWGIKTKFTLEIGLYNHLIGKYNFKTDTQYPEIVWFPQGQFLISSFNTTLSLNSCFISLSGKDKMCLLNGDLGGQLYASIDFGVEDVEETYMEKIVPPKLVNSKEIVSTNYYIKINNNNENKKYFDYDPNYIFILNNKSGHYYKIKDEHYYQYINTSSDDIIQRYDIYAKNQNPDDYFISITINNNQYKPNTYYYKNTSSLLYILDVNTSKTSNRLYYSLVPLYTNISNITKKKIPLEKIIREAVHTYAQEPYENIIINDLDQYGLEQLTYKGDKTLYGLYDDEDKQITDLFFNESVKFNSVMDEYDIGEEMFIEKAIEKEWTEQGDMFNFYDLNIEHLSSSSLLYKKPNKNDWFFNQQISDSWAKEKNLIKYYLVKITYGMDIGYHLTDLTYTGDLISGVGDTLTSILDKIKTMLSDFEYFYDINGRFVFQKKKTYVNSSWSQLTTTEDETYVNYLNASQKTIFNLNDNLLISTIQNSPVLNNIRNDFIVWGKRKSLGQELPIHTRFAIDKKPTYYKSLNGKIYLNIQASPLLKNTSVDQFLIINNLTNSYWWNFESLLEYLKIDKNSSDRVKDKFFTLKGISGDALKKQFKESPMINYDSSIENKTNISFIRIEKDEEEKYKITPSSDNGGYQISTYINGLSDIRQYYIYIPSLSYINLVDWREIIYQMALDYFKGQGCDEKHPIQVGNEKIETPDDFLYYVGKQNPEYYPTGYTGYEQYYTDMQGFWRQLYNPEYFPEIEYTKGLLQLASDNITYTWQEPDIKEYNIEYYFNASILDTLPSGEVVTKLKAEPYALKPENDLSRLYWNRNVFEAPETLNFWIDFLDSDLELAQFSIPQIGDRTKVVNETSKATSIIYPKVPDILITYGQDDNIGQSQDFLSGYTSIYVPKGYLQYFDISHRSKSLKDQVDELLQQYSYCIENITINSIPIYFLEPNSLIYVHDNDTKIDGNYIINRISVPLTYNGMMSITATKAPEQII